MRKSKIVKALIVVIGMCTISCITTPEPISVAAQEIYFEVHYSNMAWGKQEKGFLIDNAGLVKTYDGLLKWTIAKGNETLSEAQIKENLALASNTTTTIKSVDFNKYVSKIASIGQTGYSKRTSKGADQGSTTYYAYIYNSDKKTYSPLLLAETGDWSSSNLDLNAVELTTWLQNLQMEIYK